MEIERKFLVNRLPDNLDTYKSKQIEQSYISIDPVIRIRKSNQEYYLTVKSKGHLAREEFESSLTKEQYKNLLLKVDEGELISKIRYIIPIQNNLTAELDVYKGLLEGLITVEVEFNTEAEAEKFLSPKWFGREVTYEKSYKNSELFIKGLPEDLK